MPDFTQLKTDFSAASDFLVAVGDEKRQAIIIALLEADDACSEGLQVSDLTETTHLSRPAVSHHLKILRDVRLVDYHTVGTKNFYYFTHETQEINKLRKLLDNVVDIMTDDKKTAH